MQLTDEQARFAMDQFQRWLSLKEKHEIGHGSGGSVEWVTAADGGPGYIRRGERRYEPGELTRLNADIWHSALLLRLLKGKEPLDEPPPVRHAYPVYPD